MRKIFATLVLTVLSATALFAQNVDYEEWIDSAAVVTTHRNTSSLKGTISTGLKVDIARIQTFPKMFGSSDPVSYIRALPGVAATQDNTSGIMIQGCDNSQTDVLLSGIPVYGASHVLSFFSIFNTDHFSKMEFSTRSDGMRLGGKLNLDIADTLSTALHAKVSVGPLVSQATVAFPLGSKLSASVSLRRSLLDVFYKSFLSYEGTAADYSFYDVNASALWTPGPKDKIDVNFYHGRDKCSANLDVLGLNGSWGNLVGGLRWMHDGDVLKSSVQAFYTAFNSDFNLDSFAINNGKMDADISSYGLKGDFDFGVVDVKADLNFFNILPQNPSANYDGLVVEENQYRQKAVQGQLSFGREFFLTDNFSLKPLLAFSGYGENESSKKYFKVDPSLHARLDLHRAGAFDFEVGTKHQYLFQTGFTNMGFPVEFWLGAGEYSDPQEAYYTDLGYTRELAGGAFAIEAGVYGKYLRNQIEFKGCLYDLTGKAYDLNDYLFHGDGYNYGATLLFRKQSGNLTGWVSYAFGRSLRRFDDPDYPSVYPSNHERIHEVNAVASYKLGRWELGANCVFATGLPCTPAKSIYTLGNKLVVEYGEHNSLHLPPMFRLDVSATYNLKSRREGFSHSINLSVYNVTYTRNELLMTLYVKDGEFSYKPIAFLLRTLPSISYICSF